jgi:DNA methylase
MIANSSEPGAIVYDPFGGSGSTLVAAHQLGRVGFGVEIEPSYVAVTLERLAAFGWNLSGSRKVPSPHNSDGTIRRSYAFCLITATWPCPAIRERGRIEDLLGGRYSEACRRDRCHGGQRARRHLE